MEEKIGKYFGKIINFIYNFVSSTLFFSITSYCNFKQSV